MRWNIFRCNFSVDLRPKPLCSTCSDYTSLWMHRLPKYAWSVFGTTINYNSISSDNKTDHHGYVICKTLMRFPTLHIMYCAHFGTRANYFVLSLLDQLDTKLFTSTLKMLHCHRSSVYMLHHHYFYQYREQYSIITLTITMNYTREVKTTMLKVCYKTYIYRRYNLDFVLHHYNHESIQTTYCLLTSEYHNYKTKETLKPRTLLPRLKALSDNHRLYELTWQLYDVIMTLEFFSLKLQYYIWVNYSFCL